MKKLYSFHLEGETKNKMITLARKRGVSTSALINEVLEKFSSGVKEEEIKRELNKVNEASMARRLVSEAKLKSRYEKLEEKERMEAEKTRAERARLALLSDINDRPPVVWTDDTSK